MFGQSTKAIEEPVERYETKRRRELLQDLKLYDAALVSIHADIGEETRKAGLDSFGIIPVALRSRRWLALQNGLCQLSKWHSETLRELAPLI